MRRTIITLLLAAVCAASWAQTATLLLRADSLARAGLHAEALTVYARVTAMLDSMGARAPRSIRLRALAGMASCHKATGDYRDALADYTAMRDAKLLDVRGLLNMSNVCLALGLYTDVVDMLEPMDAGRWQPVRLLNLASAYAYLKRTDDALRLISQTTTDGLPADVKATTEANRGFILMSTGRSQEAANALAEAAHMTADGRTRCIITANLALAESACGRHADALAHIDSCLAWQAANIGTGHPDYAISMRKRAEILLAAGKRADAAASFKEYLELTRVEVIRSFAMLTAKQRQDFWFSRQPLVAECYETGAEDPGMAYDAALLSKSILMQADADIRQAARRDTATMRLYKITRNRQTQATALNFCARNSKVSLKNTFVITGINAFSEIAHENFHVPRIRLACTNHYPAIFRRIANSIAQQVRQDPCNFFTIHIQLVNFLLGIVNFYINIEFFSLHTICLDCIVNKFNRFCDNRLQLQFTALHLSHIQQFACNRQQTFTVFLYILRQFLLFRIQRANALIVEQLLTHQNGRDRRLHFMRNDGNESCLRHVQLMKLRNILQHNHIAPLFCSLSVISHHIYGNILHFKVAFLVVGIYFKRLALFSRLFRLLIIRLVKQATDQPPEQIISHRQPLCRFVDYLLPANIQYV